MNEICPLPSRAAGGKAIIVPSGSTGSVAAVRFALASLPAHSLCQSGHSSDMSAGFTQFFATFHGLPRDMRTLRLQTILALSLTLPGYGRARLAHVHSCEAQMSAPNRAVKAGGCCHGKADQGPACKRFGDGAPPGKIGPGTPSKDGHNAKSPQSHETTHALTLLVTPSRPVQWS